MSTPDKFSLGAARGSSGGSPGHSAESGSLGDRGGSSEPLSGLPRRDLVASRIAARQRTLVTTAQLVECGLGDDAVAHRISAGRLHVVFRGVYSWGCGVLPPLARELAGLLALGGGSFVSHRSAAFVWGMRKTPPAEVEMSVVRRHCKSREGLQVHRIGAIDRREVRRHEGLWVSSPARAVLEVAAVGSNDELVDVIDAGLALRRFTPGDMKLVLERNRPCRGSARLAALLADDTAMAISRSRAEKALLRLIRDAGLPMPETNVKFGRFEADFVWRKERVIVELDSATYHSGPGVFQHDREKGLFFRGAGYDVLRPTRAHVVHQGPRVLVLLTQALSR
ncbi:MAG TPA: type IV toxin-antitoxin system AbiEi family antitoxin domain-containing protein [Solirubrobacteraceae bacterium]|nr:type IV toxin-antitoxin system AbiEi family antitoxin domain-containing protein [Solirubrobacteraceae bacterium]